MKYYIDFNTLIDPGRLQAVTVTLEVETITDMEKPLNIALSDHPLYKELEQYVLANPYRK